MDKCPYCGCEDGVYTTYTGKQYYYFDGDPSGFNADVSDNQRVFARCIHCNRKISMKRILKEAKEERKENETIDYRL